MTGPRFTIAIHYKEERHMHIREISRSGQLAYPETRALCGAPLTADVAIAVTRERATCPMCASIYPNALIVACCQAAE